MLSHPTAESPYSCDRGQLWGFQKASTTTHAQQEATQLPTRGPVRLMGEMWHRLTLLPGRAEIYGKSLDVWAPGGPCFQRAHPSGPQAPQPRLSLRVAASASPEAASS